MRVVVTGATGNVGSSVVDALAADPDVTEVVAISRRSPRRKPRAQVREVLADVASTPLASHFAGAEAVIHLAWLFQPTHRPLQTWRSNAIGSLRVFEAAAEAGVPTLVHASSVGAYSTGPRDDYPVDEAWPTHSLPTSAYGREKAYVERLLDVVERDHPQLRVVRLRPAFIFRRASASQQRRLFMGPFVPGSLLRPGLIPLLPYPSGLRFQALHTEDVADAYVRAVKADVRGPFNLAAEGVVDGAELGRIFRARPIALPATLVRAGLATAWHARLVPASPQLFDLAMGLPLMDASRARTELGWAPRHTASEAVQEMLGGLREGAGGDTEPLAPDSPSGRLHEVATGVGERP
jgi:UDP-glucose 4-epimerase